jgi:hypothetical protein
MEIDFGCHPIFCGQDTSPRYSASKYLDLAPRGACLACEADPELSSLDGSRSRQNTRSAARRPRKRGALHGALPIPQLGARQLEMIRDELLV